MFPFGLSCFPSLCRSSVCLPGYIILAPHLIDFYNGIVPHSATTQQEALGRVQRSFAASPKINGYLGGESKSDEAGRESGDASDDNDLRATSSRLSIRCLVTLVSDRSVLSSAMLLLLSPFEHVAAGSIAVSW